MAAPEDKAECIKEVFRSFDSRRSKTIPRDQLLRVLLSLDPSFDREALVNLLELSDVVNNDEVKYEEFVEFIRPPVPSLADDTGTSQFVDLSNALPTVAVSVSPAPAVESAEAAQDEFNKEGNLLELKKIKEQKTRGHRPSIFAQKITEDAVSDYKKPVYPKDEAMKESLAKILGGEKLDVLFGHLSKDAISDVVNAFYAKEFESGTDIIVQGDRGDCLYIIAEGSVDIYVARPGPDGIASGDRGIKVVSFGVGAMFGELALMYESPRAATVQAAGPVSTWVLDANDFKMLLMKAQTETYKKYEGWLSQVSLLSSLNHFELAQLADMMQSDCFAEGEDIIVQGDEGENFYLLEDGSAAAFIQGDAGERQVKQYFGVGDYFGEIALLTQEPRRATVRATGEGCSVAYLSQTQFIDVLGPIAERLKDDVDKYPQYAQLLKDSSSQPSV